MELRSVVPATYPYMDKTLDVSCNLTFHEYDPSQM